MDITKCLTLSTAHVTEETIQTIDCEFLSDESDLVVYQKGEYGYFIYIPEDVDDLPHEIPLDLMMCIGFAYENDCQLLCLDRDGEIVDSLPVYDW